MSTVMELEQAEKALLKTYLPPFDEKQGQRRGLEQKQCRVSEADTWIASNGALMNSTIEVADHTCCGRFKERPFVSLTYACSLDGQISIAPGARTTLSGPETKSMTHYLRLQHDGILVGVGTARADDPNLNCRYQGVTTAQQPQPIIVDPSQSFNVQESSVFRLAREGRGKIPWVVCRRTPDTKDDDHIIAVDSSTRALDWRAILAKLKARGLNSIMIEGGATILNDLLLQPDLVDAVIVTIAPTWLGQGGVHVSPAPQHENGVRVNAATLRDTTWKQFGDDVVLCGRLRARREDAQGQATT